MALHPIKTTRHIRDNYIRYLKTIKTFQNDWFRKQFAAAIEEKDALVKGPLVESSPPFVKTKSIKDLVEEGLLSSGFRSLCSASLPYERQLYKHQEVAIRKILSGRNVVISTGTGSGKTEAFLIPILQHLLEEKQAGTLSQPGVRALLLYPLNALANDQMKRLRRVLSDCPEIIFGRYIGETEDEPKKAEELFEDIYPEEPRVENELLSREEMQETPPHIFLTNYAMLEYLLLRPADSRFFDGETGRYWKYIVLDEAHVYDGARANEIGMLMRRLEQRVVGCNVESKIQAIATSATIGGGKDDFPAVAQFAQGLFNVPFSYDTEDPTQQDVIESTRKPASSLGEQWGNGSPRLYRSLKDMAEIWRTSKSFSPPEQNEFQEIPKNIVNKAFAARHTPLFLYNILRGDQNLHVLRNKLEEEPQFLSEVADLLFPDTEQNEAENAVIDLVSAAILAKEDEEEAPLLPARYHVFARALEGAFVCLNQEAHRRENQKDVPSLFLKRHKFCPHCGSRVFELANCTRCGTAYLIGELKLAETLSEKEQTSFQTPSSAQVLVQNSIVYESVARGRDLSYFVLDVSDMATIDEDALVSSLDRSEEFQESANLEEMNLCPQCGAVWGEFEMRPCSCDIEPITVHKVDVGRKRTLQRCVSCSTQASRGVVYRFLTGQEAPVSIVAEALYQHLPTAQRDELLGLPGKGRKILNFTDSRQKAAFFAPYIEKTHQRNLRRRLIMQTLGEDTTARNGGLRLKDLVPRILYRAEKAGIFSDAMSHDERKREVSIWLMQEFTPLDRPISLEGVGLLKFVPDIEQSWSVPSFLAEPPWELDKTQTKNLIILLLNTLRRQGSITYLRSEIEDLAKDEAFEPRNKAFYVRRKGSVKRRHFNVYSWNPADGYSNARLNILVRFLKKKGLEEKEAKRHSLIVLRDLWDFVISNHSAWGSLFTSETKKGLGTLHRIRHDQWRFVPYPEGSLDDWYICDRCLNISSINFGGVCSTYGCEGNLLPLKNQKPLIRDNLYRNTYLHGEPIPLRAEEHTAQWVTKKAAEVQNRFIKGEVNVLSCSTTFELGVDVGDLQAVLMRNVPPTTSNYVQRAGRAGRRTNAAAFALTFAQRRPHDLNHYQHPKRMVSGQIKPPVTVLQNAKIVRRHLNSVVFASFFRWAKNHYEMEYRNAGTFFENQGDGISGASLLRKYLEGRPEDLKRALKQVLPPFEHIQTSLSIDDWGWINHLTNQKRSGTLDMAEDEVNHELKEFETLKGEAAADEKYGLAKRYKKIQSQIRSRDLFGYLGNHNVLPKYGFPTDVVSLKTDHLQGIPQASQIDLSRDLKMAISEFAPGGQVIAAKRIWHSAGIRIFPDQHWEPYQYAVCPKCERMNIRPGEEPPQQCICGASLADSKKHGTFIVPEHGFIASGRTDTPGEAPPKRFYASSVYFANYGLPGEDLGDLGNSKQMDLVLDENFSAGDISVYKGYSKYGWLAVVNDGYGGGFYICNVCGFSIPTIEGPPPEEHINPLTNKKCAGGYSCYHLGHRFMTDVLELQLDYPLGGRASIYSFLYAVLDGVSDALGVQRDDIAGTVYYRENGPAFIIYDNVPGGAGHVERAYNHLYGVFVSAKENVADCECGRDTSCYNCLRHYQNQRYHDILSRGLADDILGTALG